MEYKGWRKCHAEGCVHMVAKFWVRRMDSGKAGTVQNVRCR